MKEKLKYGLLKLKRTGFFHVFGSSVINKIIGFASSIVLVRILSKTEYGIYTYADNILGFFTLISGFGVASGVLQLCSEAKDEDSRLKTYSFGCRAGVIFNTLLAVSIIIVALVVPLPIEHSNELLLLMSFLPLVTLASELQRTYLRTELRNKEFGYTNTFNTVVTFLGSCGLAIIFREKGLVFAHYLAGICTFALICIVNKVPFSLRKQKITKDEKRQIIEISSISMLNNGLSRLMYLLDIFILGLCIQDETVVASYKIATIIPTALAFIPASIMTYVYPYFARHREEKHWVKDNYHKLVLYSGGLNVLIALVLFIFAPLILKIVFGEQYLDALAPFRILSVSFAISGTFRTIAGNLLVTQQKLKFNLFVAVFSSLMNTALNVLMIRRWESTGAAVATIITVIVTSIMNVLYLNRTIDKIPE